MIGLVVLNYNDFTTTNEFIDSIKDYRSIDYIIVVDNNSPDHSFERLKNKFQEDRIRILKAPVNGGYSKGNNIGIKYAIEELGVDYIVISNPDVVFDEKVITVMQQTMKMDKNNKVVAPKMMDEKGMDSQVQAWKLPEWGDDIILSSIFLTKLFGDPVKYHRDYIHEGLNYVDVVPGSFFMVEAEAIKEIGYLDEAVFLYCEERILGYKMKAMGYKEVLNGDISYIHKHSVTIDKNIKNNIKKIKILNESKRIYHDKYLRVNGIKRLIFDLASTVSIIEQNIIFALRTIYRKEK